MFDLSVIICTYNRCESLRDTLRALKQQELPEGVRLEILVVDNNSTDGTREVVRQEAADSGWLIRYLFESQQGLSRARNCGIREARGELVAFIDDDELAAPGWLRDLYGVCREYQADCVGGRILLKWISPPPDWLVYHRLEGQLGFLDRGPKPIVADSSTGEGFLFGGNIAFSRKIFDEVGLFRTDLGVVGGRPARGEDSEMLQRLLKAGKKVVYAPNAVVYHKITADRMRKSYFRRLTFGSHRALTAMGAPISKDTQSRVPLWLVKECSANGLRALWAYGGGQEELAFRRELLFWSQLGRIAGAWTT